MSQNYSMRKRMSIITELYQIVRNNREQIQNLIAENEALENRIETLALENYIGQSDTEDDEYEEENAPTHCRQLFGYINPQSISKELADFLGKPEDALITRTEVIRHLISYIQTHGLRDMTNRRKINPDDSLKALLKLNDDVELTYCNLQKYLRPHFTQILNELL